MPRCTDLSGSRNRARSPVANARGDEAGGGGGAGASLGASGAAAAGASAASAASANASLASSSAGASPKLPPTVCASFLMRSPAATKKSRELDNNASLFCRMSSVFSPTLSPSAATFSMRPGPSSSTGAGVSSTAAGVTV